MSQHLAPAVADEALPPLRGENRVRLGVPKLGRAAQGTPADLERQRRRAGDGPELHEGRDLRPEDARLLRGGDAPFHGGRGPLGVSGAPLARALLPDRGG